MRKWIVPGPACRPARHKRPRRVGTRRYHAAAAAAARGGGDDAVLPPVLRCGAVVWCGAVVRCCGGALRCCAWAALLAAAAVMPPGRAPCAACPS
eukprot:106933-Prymnesium_polylepis.2